MQGHDCQCSERRSRRRYWKCVDHFINLPLSSAHTSHTVTYLFRTTGQVLGVSLSGTVLQAVLLRTLRSKITGPNSEEVRKPDMRTLNTITDKRTAIYAPVFRSSQAFGTITSIALCVQSCLTFPLAVIQYRLYPISVLHIAKQP